MSASRIAALGTCLPAAEISTDEMLRRQASDQVFDVERITGIRTRRMADRDHGEDTVALGVRAALDCLSRSGYEASDIDVVIGAATTVHSGHSMVFEPASAHEIARRIGADNAAGYDVANACAGTTTAIYLLDRLIRAGIVRNGLVVTAELISSVTEGALAEASDPRDPQFAALTLGDAAVAVLLDRAVDDSDRIDYVELTTAGAFAHLCLALPSEHTQNMVMLTDNLTMQASPRRRTWAHLARDLLAKRGTSFADEQFDHIVFHQLGVGFTPKIAADAENVLETTMPPTVSTVDKYGNTGATSHFVALTDQLANGAVAPGAKVCVVPTASGMVFGVMSAKLPGGKRR